MYGIKLRQLRRQLGLTQRQLGTLCGVGGTTISMIEHGKRLPGRETLRRLQAVLGDLPPRPAKPLPTAELLPRGGGCVPAGGGGGRGPPGPGRGRGSGGCARCGGCAAGPAARTSPLPPTLPGRRKAPPGKPDGALPKANIYPSRSPLAAGCCGVMRITPPAE